MVAHGRTGGQHTNPMLKTGLTKLVESFLASSAPSGGGSDAADSAAEGERGTDDDGVLKEEGSVEVDDGGPEELLRLLTSDEVGISIFK